VNSNKDNPRIGRDFQEKVQKWFQKEYKENFETEQGIDIGVPAKSHKFDVANETKTIVVECKCYVWTESGNVPSAKLRGLNEAVFYFSFLPPETEKYLVMARSLHPVSKETLADYYIRTNGHLLGDVKLLEFDEISKTTREIN
jgi:hypothetical protein